MNFPAWPSPKGEIICKQHIKLSQNVALHLLGAVGADRKSNQVTSVILVDGAVVLLKPLKTACSIYTMRGPVRLGRTANACSHYTAIHCSHYACSIYIMPRVRAQKAQQDRSNAQVSPGAKGPRILRPPG
jgi:hypothetical protein